METPSIGLLLLPVLLWVAAGVALALALRRSASATLVHRLVALVVGLWALLATTALAWVLVNGGWSALVGLLARPPEIFTLAAGNVWLFGALGAVGILALVFAFNQFVGQGFLRLYRSAPVPWPESLRAAAGATRLYEVDLPRADAFSYTLVARSGRTFHRVEIVVLSRQLRAALTPEEEVAVLAHELGHVRELDVRYLTFFRTFSQLMRWDPVLGYLSGLVSRREEIQADADAVELTGRPLALARALYKALQTPTRPGSSVGAIGFLGVGGRRGRRLALARIRRLVELAESGAFPEERGA